MPAMCDATDASSSSVSMKSLCAKKKRDGGGAYTSDSPSTDRGGRRWQKETEGGGGARDVENFRQARRGVRGEGAEPAGQGREGVVHFEVHILHNC